MVEIIENDFNGTLYIEVPLKSLRGTFKWRILIDEPCNFHNRQPLEITKEKKEIAKKIVKILNNG